MTGQLQPATGAVPEALEAGIARYESFARVDPDNALIRTTLGDLYHRAGRLDEAIAAYEEAQRLEPGNVIPQSRLAGVALSRHDFAGAEQRIRALLERGEADPALLHNLGLALFHQERWTEAMEAFERAEAGGSALPDSLRYRAYAAHHAGETERALVLAREWAERNPGDRAEGYVSLLEMDHGEFEQARKRASAVLEREPENADAAVVVGTWMLESQEMERALTLFRGVTQREPENPRGWMGLGLIHLYAQRFPLSIQTLERARSLMPNNLGTLVTLGWARLLSQDLAGAEREFRHAVGVNRNFAEAHGGLASVLALQRKDEEARVEVARAFGLDRQCFGAVFARSQLLEHAGKRTQAMRLMEGALQRYPREGGPSLIESIQTFARREAARAAPATGKPEPPAKDTER